MYKTISVDELWALTQKILTSAGETEENAKLIFENLLEDEYMNKPTHGFYRIPQIVGDLKPHPANGSIRISSDKNRITVDGNGAIGLVAVRKACEKIVEISKSEPLIIAGVRGYHSTTGAAGYYTRYLARHGLISFLTCNVSVSVVPFGSMEPHLGTNPFSIGFPCGDNPVVSDIATSACSYGQLALRSKANEPIPEGLILDKNGYPSTDPKDVTERGGSQLPLAGAKGYALGLAFEILAGLFTGAKSGDGSTVPGSDGTFILAFRPDIFVDSAQYSHNLDAFLSEVRNSKPVPGGRPVRIPGQYDTAAYEDKKRSGKITLMTKVYEDMLACL